MNQPMMIFVLQLSMYFQIISLIFLKVKSVDIVLGPSFLLVRQILNITQYVKLKNVQEISRCTTERKIARIYILANYASRTLLQRKHNMATIKTPGLGFTKSILTCLPKCDVTTQITMVVLTSHLKTNLSVLGNQAHVLLTLTHKLRLHLILALKPQ